MDYNNLHNMILIRQSFKIEYSKDSYFGEYNIKNIDHCPKYKRTVVIRGLLDIFKDGLTNFKEIPHDKIRLLTILMGNMRLSVSNFIVETFIW